MKLKHRITGTILMIAFATTTALPAAGIPNFKAPAVKVPATPKVVAAPKVPVVPKVPVTPKVPVVPKIVSAPKVPVVKVPTVKVPVTPKVPTVKVPTTPKVPAVVKVPAVKVPSVKVPATPKNPTVVKTPVRVPAAPKTPAVAKTPAKVPSTPKTTLVSNKAVTSKVSPKIVSNNATVAASGIRQAVRGAQLDNPQNAPEVGVKTDLPKLPGREVKVGGRSSTEKPGTGGRKMDENLFDVLRGKGGKTESTGLFGDLIPKRDVPALTDISQTGKSFDQGFNSSAPDLSGFDKDSFGPMNGITNGGSIGGPLGEQAEASSSSSQPTSGAVGSGMVGYLPTKDIPAGQNVDFRHVDPKDKNHELYHTTDPKTGDYTIIEVYKNQVVDTEKGNVNTDPPAWATLPDKNSLKSQYNDAKAAQDKKTGGAGTPDPENAGTVQVDIYSLSPGIAQQVGQSHSGKKGSQGGSGDMTPTNDSTSSPVRTGNTVANVGTQIKNSLVGNPGQNGGMREGGSTANAPVRSNGSGVVTPTNDQNVSSSGGRQEDAGDFFGNGIGPDQSRLSGSNSSNSSNNNSTNNKKEKKSK